MKRLILAGLLVAATAVAYLGYFWVTYIDETTVVGTAFGFSIGQTEAEAYAVARRHYLEDAVWGIQTISSQAEEMR